MTTQFPLSRILSRSIASLLTLAAFTGATHAATKIWDGGAAGTGTDLATAANWSGDTLPAVNDTLQWAGTAPGNLSLTLTNSTAFAGNNGYFIDVTAAQTGSLQIDNVTANNSANGIRLANITLAAGSGAFTLGNGSGTSVFILGSGTTTTSNTWTNNGANAATISSDVIWADGGAVANRVLTLTGSGDWIMNAGYGITVTGGTGSLALTKTGAGTLFMNATGNYTGTTTIGTGSGAGVIRAAANQALGIGTVVLDTAGNGSTARLELTGGIALSNAITFSGRNNASVALQNLSGNNTLSGVVTLGTGGGTYIVQSDSGTLTLGNATSITGGSTTNGRTVTLQGAGDGVISGAIINGNATVGITKAGAGTWTLNGTSSYTGPTTINEGTLQIGNGTVNGDLTGGGNIVNNATLLLNRSGTATFTNANVISGAGTLTKLGTGTQILTGANTYTGPTNINAGTLGFAVSGQFLTGTVTVADGAALSVRSADTATTLVSASNIVVGSSGTGTLTFDFNALDTTAPLISTADLTLNGTPAISFLNGGGLTTGTHALLDYITLSGLGTLPSGPFTLSPRSVGTLVNDTANTMLKLNVTGDSPKWTGLDSGTWTVGTTGANRNWKLIGANTTTDYLDGDLVLFDDTATGFRNISIPANVTPTGTTVSNTTAGGAYTFSGAGKIGGAGALIKQGNGTLIIANTGINDYTGGTTISEGTLQIGDGATAGAGTIPSTGTLTNNGTLVLNRPDDFTIPQAIGGTGTIIKNTANTVTFTAAATNSHEYAINGGKLKFTGGGTLSGAITGTGGLETTTGNFRLSGFDANTYTGLTTVSGGQLQLAKDPGVNAVGGDITITGSGQISLVATEQIPDTATVTLLGTSTDSILASVAGETIANIIVNSTTPGTGGGQVVMRNGLNVTGTGTLISGILGVGSGQTATVNAINILSAPGSNGVLRIAGNTTASTLNVGPGGITASGGEIQVKFNTTNQDATINLAGDFTTTGNVSITNGGYTGTSLNVINLTGTRTFNIGSGTTTTVAPDLGGTGALTKAGNGTLTLNASVAATYSGDTTVDAGTLVLLGSVTGSTNVNVNTGTLRGTGSITGTLHVGNGIGTQDALLAPGAAAATLGTLTTADVTFGSDSVFSLELNTDGTPATDLLSSTGTVTLSLAATLSVTNLGTTILTGGQTFNIITATGVTGQFGNAPDGTILAVGPNFFEVNYTASSVQLIATVPEPTTAPALLAGSLLLGWRRRRS